jgi:hypothetical protein
MAESHAKPDFIRAKGTVMELDIWQRLRHRFPTRIAGVDSGKLAAALIILIVPGGLVLPLCYAAYAAVANAAARKSASDRLNDVTAAPAALNAFPAPARFSDASATR